ncbi:CHAT domain-containing protein [Streptomyces sp. NPDC101169]|uniref:CHAT domain-containing protein n=1 Tax=Streptomyces sp. NPDC101169 TaxID=3366121 RepID=UPI0037F4B773
MSGGKAGREGQDWRWRLAAAGDAFAMRVLATALAEDGRHDEAVAWWEKAIAAGDETALHQLADHMGARTLEGQLRRQAESGDVTAMGNLAKLLVRNSGGQRLAEAVHWLTLAVRAGVTPERELVAALDSAGRSAEAEDRLRHMAAAGDLRALRDLVRRLREGDDGERLDEAVVWLTRGVAAGEPWEWDLVAVLDRAGRADEAEARLRRLADRHDVKAVATLVRRAPENMRAQVSRRELDGPVRARAVDHVRRVAAALARLDLREEAVRWWTAADALDDRVCSSPAARLAARPAPVSGAPDSGVEWQLQEMAATDDVTATRVLAGYLARTGQTAEAVRMWTRADAADGRGLWGDVLEQRALGGASDTVTSHGVQGGAPGDGVVGDASPADAESEETPAGTVEEPDTAPATATHRLSAQMPSHAGLYEPVSLVVRVPFGAAHDDDGVSAPLAGFRPAPDGSPLTLIVRAPAGLDPQGPLEHTLLVPPSDAPAPVRFAFLTREPGLHRVRVSAWAGGTFLTEIGLEVTVERDGPYAVEPPSTADMGEIRAHPGEVTLLVDRVGDQYTFRLISDRCIYGAVLAQALTAAPEAAAERAYAMLQRLAAGRGEYSGAHARRWMKETGVGLWTEMVPDAVKEQFWQLRDHITAFSVASEHDVLPWELLYPVAPGRDEGFLVQQFPVLRNSLGQTRSSVLPIGEPHYVVSARAPVNGDSEIESIRRILGTGTVVDTLDGVLTVIDAGTTGPLHFTCHNTFDPGGGSSILLADGPFVPALLNSAVARRALQDGRPLVFVNACRAAGAVPQYTRMLGWAQQFMGAGAGAFVGTLWAVRSDSAQRFAEAFYASLSAGEPLGTAVHRARSHAGHDETDPTWLAYTVYGDPTAIVSTSVPAPAAAVFSPARAVPTPVRCEDT